MEISITHSAENQIYVRLVAKKGVKEEKNLLRISLLPLRN